MFYATLLLLAQTNKPAALPDLAALFMRSMSAIKEKSSGALSLTSASNLSGRVLTNVYELRFRQPNQLVGHWTANGGGTRLDMDFQVRNNSFTAYDRIAGQALSRDVGAKQSLEKKLTSALGALGQTLDLALDPAVYSSIINGLERLSPWNVETHDQSVRLLHPKVGEQTGSVALEINPHTYLPLELRYQMENRFVDYRFDWNSHNAMALPASIAIPGDAKYVDSFTEHPAEPDNADQGATLTLEAAARAFFRATSLKYKVREGTQTTRVIWNGLGCRQDRDDLSWGFYKGVLSIVDHRSQKRYRGKIKSLHVSDYLARLGGDVEVTLRALLLHRNPIEMLYVSVKSARTVAETSKIKIVELSSPGLAIQLEFAAGKPLPVNAVTQNFGPKGQIISSTERSYDFISTTTRFEPRAFDLFPPSEPSLPLPVK